MRDKVVIRDDLHPEDSAMVQALYSRSPAPVEEHLEKVERGGSGGFMDRYYVGYNHASIGDCGTTTIFVENVSMLAAKAIQDWPLYSGQEASTRYMDFSKVVFENPMGPGNGGDIGSLIQGSWRIFYMKALPRIEAEVRRRYPRGDADESAYDKAVRVRTFDVARAFLPAGAHTNLSWTTNLRQARDKLAWLVHHPSNSISKLALRIRSALAEKYPHSGFKRLPEQNRADIPQSKYRAVMMGDAYFIPPDEARRPGELDFTCSFFHENFAFHAEALRNRPFRAELHPSLAEVGMVRSIYNLDFGSFRDLQRHRNGVVRMPLLTTRLGFHPWYLSQLPEDLRDEAKVFLREQEGRIKELEILGCSPVNAQNYIAMGYLVTCAVTQPLPAFIYRVELRSQKTVHPTLREMVRREAAAFRAEYPWIPIYTDDDPDDLSLRRGKQTIEERGGAA